MSKKSRRVKAVMMLNGTNPRLLAEAHGINVYTFRTVMARYLGKKKEASAWGVETRKVIDILTPFVDAAGKMRVKEVTF